MGRWDRPARVAPAPSLHSKGGVLRNLSIVDSEFLFFFSRSSSLHRRPLGFRPQARTPSRMGPPPALRPGLRSGLRLPSSRVGRGAQRGRGLRRDRGDSCGPSSSGPPLASRSSDTLRKVGRRLTLGRGAKTKPELTVQGGGRAAG